MFYLNKIDSFTLPRARRHVCLTLFAALLLSPGQEGQARKLPSPVCGGKDVFEVMKTCQQVINRAQNNETKAAALTQICKSQSSAEFFDKFLDPTLTVMTRSCDKALELVPDFLPAIEARARGRQLLGRFTPRPQLKARLFKMARKDVDLLVKIAPDHATTALAQARYAFDTGDYAAATNYLGIAAARAPDLPDIYELRGRIEHINGHEQKAINNFVRSTELGPPRANITLSIARFYLKQGQRSKALEYLRKTLTANDPKSYSRTEAFRLRGELRLAAGDKVGAKADFLQGLALDEGNSAIWKKLELIVGSALPTPFTCMTPASDYNRTIQLCSTVLQYVKSYVSIEARAKAYEALKQYDLAAADYTKLIENEPSWPGYYRSRARVYDLAGRYRDALRDIDESIARARKKSPPPSDISYALRLRAEILAHLALVKRHR